MMKIAVQPQINEASAPQPIDHTAAIQDNQMNASQDIYESYTIKASLSDLPAPGSTSETQQKRSRLFDLHAAQND